MEYEFPINIFSRKSDELVDYQNRLNEISEQLVELSESVADNNEGSYADKIVALHEVISKKTEEVESWLSSLIPLVENYGLEINDIVMCRSEHQDFKLNIDEFTNGCQQIIKKADSIKDKWRKYSGNAISSEANRMIQVLEQDLVLAKREEDWHKLRKVERKIDKLHENKFIYKSVIEELNQINFQANINKIQDIVARIQNIEDIDKRYAIKLSNLDIVTPQSLWHTDIATSPVTKSGQSLVSMNYQAKQISEQRRNKKMVVGFTFGVLALAIPVVGPITFAAVAASETIAGLTAVSMAKDSFSEGKPIQGTFDAVTATAAALGGTVLKGVKHAKDGLKSKVVANGKQNINFLSKYKMTQQYNVPKVSKSILKIPKVNLTSQMSYQMCCIIESLIEKIVVIDNVNTITSITMETFESIKNETGSEQIFVGVETGTVGYTKYQLLNNEEFYNDLHKHILKVINFK